MDQDRESDTPIVERETHSVERFDAPKEVTEATGIASQVIAKESKEGSVYGFLGCRPGPIEKSVIVGYKNLDQSGQQGERWIAVVSDENGPVGAYGSDHPSNFNALKDPSRYSMAAMTYYSLSEGSVSKLSEGDKKKSFLSWRR